MEEIWRDIVGYEHYYQVSNLGRIKTCDKLLLDASSNTILIKGKLLKSVTVGKYKGITLYKNNVGKSTRTHRLVAEAFIPNPDNKPQVNHIDADKANNNLSNLEWVTISENIKHAFAMGLMNNFARKRHKFKKGGTSHNGKLVVNLETGIYYDSCKKAAEVYGVSKTCLRSMLIGKTYNRSSFIYC